ncbi:MAG TPA: PilZ domain-containing protein [Pyrinomonadaceae bacterium]
MGAERRKAKRFRVNLPARWEGLRARDQGTISDLSLTGCFVLTAGRTERGEAIRLAMQLPGGVRISLGAEVVYYTEEIGFAVQFTEGEAADKRQLAAFLKRKQAEEGDA